MLGSDPTATHDLIAGRFVESLVAALLEEEGRSAVTGPIFNRLLELTHPEP